MAKENKGFFFPLSTKPPGASSPWLLLPHSNSKWTTSSNVVPRLDLISDLFKHRHVGHPSEDMAPEPPSGRGSSGGRCPDGPWEPVLWPSQRGTLRSAAIACLRPPRSVKHLHASSCRRPSPQPVSHSPFISHYDNKRKESERGAQVTGVVGRALGPLLLTSRVNLFPRCWEVPSNIS